MGRDKLQIPVEGTPMLTRVCEAVRRCVTRTRVVVHDDAPPLPLPVPVITDRYPTRAPVAGIATALAQAETPWVLVVAGDLPFVEPAVVLALIALAPLEAPYHSVAPCGPRGPEPLLALYRRELHARFEQRIAAGELALQPLLLGDDTLLVPAADVATIDPQLRSLHNVNRPEDLPGATP